MLPYRKFIEDIADLVISTPLLVYFWVDRAWRTPNSQNSIADHEARWAEPALAQITQQGYPMCGRFSVPGRGLSRHAPITGNCLLMPL
jgi:hypothetical protein